MADCDGEDDVALKVFGTPERELRRRWLHEEEEEIDSSPQSQHDEPTQQVRTHTRPPETSKIPPFLSPYIYTS